MAVGDVYEVTDVQELFDQEVLNVYFYRQQGPFVPLEGTIAQNLADEWAETVLPTILALQSPDLTHVEVRVKNLFDDVDQGTAVVGLTGTYVSTDTAPGFVAAGIGLLSDNAAVKDGAKRYGGISDDQQGDGVFGGSAITALNAIGEAISTPITGGLIITDDIMFPIVVKRIRSGSPGSYTYRLPEEPGELVYGRVIEALVKLVVTSQISRKIGVGL